MQKLRRTCCSDGFHLNMFNVFSLLSLLVASVMLLYMLNYPVMYSLSERERAAVNMQGTVFNLARLKIVPCYHHELVSHSMPEHIEALTNLVTKYL